jgi:hypothetical protein
MTIDSIPEIININQFYAFHKKSGKISIGTIIGKSAITNLVYYAIDGIRYKMHSSDCLTNDKPVVEFEKNKLIGYLNKEDLIKDYEKYLALKEKNKKQRKTYYMVNKEIFACKTTTVKNIWANNKYFDNKEDAINFANKGIAKTKKLIEKYLNTLKTLKTALDEIDKSIQVEDISIKDYTAKPSTLKVNDLLVKFEGKKYKHTYLGEIKEDSAVTVKEFITPQIAKLSNGTILIEQECYPSWPCYVKYENKDAISKSFLKETIKRSKYLINLENNTIEKLSRFFENYIPFETKYDGGICFYKKNTEELIEGITDFINDNSIKTN